MHTIQQIACCSCYYCLMHTLLNMQDAAATQIIQLVDKYGAVECLMLPALHAKPNEGKDYQFSS